MNDHSPLKRLIEALLFSADEPLPIEAIIQRLQVHDLDLNKQIISESLEELQKDYAGRGIELKAPAGRWAFRTAPDLGFLLRHEKIVYKKLSKMAMDVLAIIAYRQPVTRGDIEAIRGTALGRDTLDKLLESEWVKPHKRREVPGRPLAYVTTDSFLDHFGLTDFNQLPGLKEMRDSGLLDAVPTTHLGPLFAGNDDER